MTSKEIIIKLIDEKLINGEEAYILINDILKAEMVAVNEELKKIQTPNYPYTNPSIYPSVTGLTGTATDTTANTINTNIGAHDASSIK